MVKVTIYYLESVRLFKFTFVIVQEYLKFTHYFLGEIRTWKIDTNLSWCYSLGLDGILSEKHFLISFPMKALEDRTHFFTQNILVVSLYPYQKLTPYVFTKKLLFF